jgi:hypothetical protein
MCPLLKIDKQQDKKLERNEKKNSMSKREGKKKVTFLFLMNRSAPASSNKRTHDLKPSLTAVLKGVSPCE